MVTVDPTSVCGWAAAGDGQSPQNIKIHIALSWRLPVGVDVCMPTELYERDCTLWSRRTVGEDFTQWVFQRGLVADGQGRFNAVVPAIGDLYILACCPGHYPWTLQVSETDWIAEPKFEIPMRRREETPWAFAKLREGNLAAPTGSVLQMCDVSLPSQPTLPAQYIESDGRFSLDHFIPGHAYHLVLSMDRQPVPFIAQQSSLQVGQVVWF